MRGEGGLAHNSSPRGRSLGIPLQDWGSQSQAPGRSVNPEAVGGTSSYATYAAEKASASKGCVQYTARTRIE